MAVQIRSTLLLLAVMAMGLLVPAAARSAGNAPLDITGQNYQAVVNDIAGQVVAKLPDDIHFRLIGIGPIEGDERGLADALTAKIKAETRYKLIERKDLDKILREQGIQLSPIADDRRPVEPGKIKGVEGILMGRVAKKELSILYCSMDVFIKLDDVEGGEVVFAEHFRAQYLPQTTIYGAVGIIILILLVIYAKRSKRRAVEKTHAEVAEDEIRLLDLQDGLKKARDNLNRAHDDLVKADLMELSVNLRKGALKEVKALLTTIENSPGLHPDGDDKKARAEALKHNQKMAGLIKNIYAESEKLLKVVKAGDVKKVPAIAEDLKIEAKNATNAFHDRKAGRA